MLSYIRRAQRRRLYERANSDSGQYSTNEPESPASSSTNGQNSEGFHFYSTVKRQRSLPEVGRIDLGEKTTLNEKRLTENLVDTKTNEATKTASSE